MRVSRLLLCMVFAVVVSLAGCASAFMAGSSPSAAPPSSMATYRIAACANSAGQVVAGPAATYYLTNEAFYEIEANGKGAQITNQWSDDKGRYFFTYVRTSHGFMYFIPKDPSAQSMRFVYPKGTYRVNTEGDTMRPVGNATFVCVLQKT